MILMSSKLDKSWQAESDSHILSEAQKIMNDPKRLKAATKIAEDKVSEAQKQVASLKALGGKLGKARAPKPRKK